MAESNGFQAMHGGVFHGPPEEGSERLAFCLFLARSAPFPVAISSIRERNILL
ncbi:hypothetical protein [Pseudomonas sp. GV071]|jgi:hypothetical protein|uniref:hypothetical protein n=1 Tax=Pseudomonas sp. GV071 TaxID=2135754 RepID=UPI000D4C4F6E|nr:hypothetical protein [Pseudomonas sp. GV071]PTQ67061.1 hypothetical protein C8K61_11743 [Pseudomonas sp. GV071]